MRVEFGLFEGDELLQKGVFDVKNKENTETTGNLTIKHVLHDEAAEIILELFNEGERLIKATLNMPIHESEDWESIELEKYTLAFWCT